MASIGVVTGLAIETRLLDRSRLAVACAAADPARARFEADRLIGEGARGLVSFGLAGGLDPLLKPGDVIIAESVILEDGRTLATDSEWRRTVLDRTSLHASELHSGPIAASRGVLSSVADKRALFHSTGALAVDMESGPVALAAEAARAKFLIIRAVADPAWRSLPAIALISPNREGEVRLAAVLPRLIARPQDWPRVAALSRDAQAGLKALRQFADALRLSGFL